MLGKLIAIACIPFVYLPAAASVDPKIAEFCLKASDFGGCVQTLTVNKNTNFCLKAIDFQGCMKLLSGDQGTTKQVGQPQSQQQQTEGVSTPVQGTGNSNRVAVETPPQYAYEKDTVGQLLVRGSYGRYLTFVGNTTSSYSGTAGSPGTVSCSTIGTYTSCNRIGYVAPKAGGVQAGRFRYELDCQDGTYNIIGDLVTAGGMRGGWSNVANDPVAEAVATAYCPIIHTLPKLTLKADSPNKGRSPNQAPAAKTNSLPRTRNKMQLTGGV